MYASVCNSSLTMYPLYKQTQQLRSTSVLKLGSEYSPAHKVFLSWHHQLKSEWPTKAKEAPSPHEVRLALLDTKPVFQCLGYMAKNL